MGVEVRVAEILGLVFPQEGNIAVGLDAGARRLCEVRWCRSGRVGCGLLRRSSRNGGCILTPKIEQRGVPYPGLQCDETKGRSAK